MKNDQDLRISRILSEHVHFRSKFHENWTNRGSLVNIHSSTSQFITYLATVKKASRAHSQGCQCPRLPTPGRQSYFRERTIPKCRHKEGWHRSNCGRARSRQFVSDWRGRSNSDGTGITCLPNSQAVKLYRITKAEISSFHKYMNAKFFPLHFN